LRGDDYDGWTGKITFTKPKGGAYNPVPSKVEKESLEVVTQRESTLGLFHAVGKVVYNKREEPTDTPPPQPPSWLPQHKRLKVSEVDAESVLNELGTDIQTFVSALHENYVLSCQETTTEDTVDTINGCIDSLSDSDILCPDRFTRRGFQGVATDALRQDEISFYISVLGLLFSLPHPVKRIAPPSGMGASGKPLGRGTAYQVLYPRSMQVWRRREEIEESLEKIINIMYNGNASDGGPSSAPDRAAGNGGVETWAKGNRFTGSTSKPSASTQAHDDENPSAASSGLMALGMTNKLELLLETLPFAGTIQRRKRNPTRDPMLKDVEVVTRIQSSIAQADASDQDLEAEVTPEEVWSTDKPSEESVAAHNKNRSGIRLKDGGDSVVIQEKGQAMVLSDDDIEDD
jgi:cell cycle checkpoint protein